MAEIRRGGRHTRAAESEEKLNPSTSINQEHLARLTDMGTRLAEVERDINIKIQKLYGELQRKLKERSPPSPSAQAEKPVNRECTGFGLTNELSENSSFKEMACRVFERKSHPACWCKENPKSYWFEPRNRIKILKRTRKETDKKESEKQRKDGIQTRFIQVTAVERRDPLNEEFGAKVILKVQGSDGKPRRIEKFLPGYRSDGNSREPQQRLHRRATRQTDK